MYTKHFGLTILPFENVPDPRFFFDQGQHERVRNRTTDSLQAGRGLMVITGPIGSGKTTLSQMIISTFSVDIKLVWMSEPPENSVDLFLFIAQELGLTPSISERVFLLKDIKEVLVKMSEDGQKCLVIIDEAHLMTDDIVNGIRLLNNLEQGSIKLIQTLLLGQDELMEIISRPDMEHFKQRIATLENLGKMSPERIRTYIAHRLQVAGGEASLYADTGWEALDSAFSLGCTPRVINSVCDRSFTIAFEKGKTVIDVDDVYMATEGMEFQKEVFHYKVGLTHSGRGEKGQQEDTEQVTSEQSGSFLEEDTSVLQKRTVVMRPARKISRPKSFSATRRRSDVLPENNQKGVAVPVLFLLLSLAALVVSMFFY